jgi:hypothetical protein
MHPEDNEDPTSMPRHVSRRFGSMTIDPLATKPIPMTYDELLAEIDATSRRYLANPSPNHKPGEIAAKGLRLHRLISARDAWDEHVESTTPTIAGVA